MKPYHGSGVGPLKWVMEAAMANREPSTGHLGAILGAIIALAVAVFVLNGGEHLGKKTVHGDADLPPVATR